MSAITGKTIAAVIKHPFGDYILRFTDGTGARFAGEGYEVEDTRLDILTPEKLYRAEAEISVVPS